MLAEDYHIFHYLGIARLDKQTREPYLLMRHKEKGFIHPSNMNYALYPESTVRLAMLTPCDSSLGSMLGFASRLHVPATVTMQFPVSRRATILFLQKFYDALCHGTTVDAAMSQARRAIANSLQNGEWAAPVLFSRSQDGILFRLVASNRANAKKGWTR
jgi:hypothetical protein